MSLTPADVEEEYSKSKQLRKEDVEALQQWCRKQPHLPPITELQVLQFLHSCFYRMEPAKIALDNYFTVRRHVPEFFQNKNPRTANAEEYMKIGLYVPLPKLTHDNYRVMYCRVMNPNSSILQFNDQVKNFDMSVSMWLLEEGTADGFVILSDMQMIRLGHLAKLSFIGIKKLFFYLQESLPVRMKGLHFINVVPFMDKVMAFMRPFLKKELHDMIHLHTESIESLYKFIPKECLPSDYGGTADSIATLHENMKKKMVDNAAFFKEDEKQMVDESKRPGKPKHVGDLFGIEGSFKKLDID